jgi:hypothetical protein
VRAAGKATPTWSDTPLWEMIASTIAFAAWASALPGSPFRAFGSVYNAAVAGFVVIFTSAALGLISPLFQNPLSPETPKPDDQPQR